MNESEQLPPTFTSAEAEHLGLSRRRLLALRGRGEIERIGHGLYRRADANLVDLDLIEIAIKAPTATLCLVSALARHELTDIIPPMIDLALPRGTWQPITSSPIRWHKFAAATFDLGRTTLQVDTGLKIGLYDAPRSIVDVFRLANRIGADVGYEALRRWLRAGGKPSELIRVARQFPRAYPAVLHATQVIG